ncbi:MAG: beta-lactamase family protein [Bacteroidetes bacterium]|nr:beta-lactamase family protein [Bacteroidota bacterium]
MKNIMRILFISFLSILFFVNCGHNNPPEDKLKSELDKIRQELNIPGINLAIVTPDKKIAVSAGYSDKEKKEIMTPEDVMFSGSTGKTFCAAIILQLIDEGNLGVDDYLSQYFGKEEWFDKIPNAHEVTIRMLLNHTSGIPRYIFDDSVWKTAKENPDKTWTGVERLSYIFNAKPVHEAGKGWSYSDTNYIILGMLIEKLTGNDYYTELSHRILKPYELTNTYPGNSREIPGLVTGYTGYSEVFFVPEKVLLDNRKLAFNPQMEFTGGGIACTVVDLAKWGRIYYSGKPFSEKSLQMLKTDSGFKTSLPDDAGYGFASFIWSENNQVSYGHTGMFPGYVTIVEYMPTSDICLAMQWNTDQKNPEKSLHQYLNKIKLLL